METATKTIWNIDPTHSEIQFKVKHLVISTVTGHFREFEGTVETEGDDFSTAEITFSANTASVDTNNEQRDGHLQSREFFDSAQYPTMAFKSTSVQSKGDDNYVILGDLTIKDKTSPVELKAEYGGYMTDFYGNYKAGFEVKGKINRKEFGLVWNGVTEAGGIVVSDEVKLEFNIQVAKQA